MVSERRMVNCEQWPRDNGRGVCIEGRNGDSGGGRGESVNIVNNSIGAFRESGGAKQERR